MTIIPRIIHENGIFLDPVVIAMNSRYIIDRID
ncbi:hypothetical protein M2403_001377 [Rahnella sp. BIGb0603]|nr:hypothetical protein [Rahnella sp. BIGb0603]